MKIENTPENKARFFAQYLNQKVYTHLKYGTEGPVENDTIRISWIMGSGRDDGYYLSLRSIESLTDEEATYLAKLINCSPYNIPVKTEIHTKHEFGKLQTWLRVFYWYKEEQKILYNVSEGGISHPNGNCYFKGWVKAADYLRSIGILIPWMDLSVEDLVEYGWVKVKEITHD